MINFDCGLLLMECKYIMFLVVLFGYLYFYGGVFGGQVELVCVFKVNVGLFLVFGSFSDECVFFFSDILFMGY